MSSFECEYRMCNTIKHFVKIYAETLPISEPIYEFGVRQAPMQEGFADLRRLFPGRKYIGADIQEGPGVIRGVRSLVAGDVRIPERLKNLK